MLQIGKIILGVIVAMLPNEFGLFDSGDWFTDAFLCSELSLCVTFGSSYALFICCYECSLAYIREKFLTNSGKFSKA